MQQHPRSGHLLAVSVASLALTGVAAWLAVHSAHSRATSNASSTSGVQPAPLMSMRPAWVEGGQFNAPPLDSMLRRVSLDPSALAAAGVTTQQGVAGVVGAVETYLAQSGAALAAAEADWKAAKVQCESLERVIRRGRGSQQDLADLSTARSNLSSYASTYQSALDAVFDAGVDGLAVEVVTRLTAIRANRGTEFRELPVQHLVESRTDTALLALREALAEERICAKWNETPSAGTTTLLGNERARTEVAQARSRLDSSLASVESYWNAAIEP